MFGAINSPTPYSTRHFFWAVVFISIFKVAAFGVSGKITYQGQLREQGVPVTGSKTMAFRIFTSSIAGSAVWTTGTQTISVENGLFRVLLQPVGVDWESAAFIEVEVDGITLSPREELTSSAYAFDAGLLSGKSYISALSAPVSPGAGDLWYDTAGNNLNVWTGTRWSQTVQSTMTAGSITNVHIAANAAIQLSKLEKDPSQLGTINLSTNPVDWSELKNVPAGFEDGIDNTGGGGAAILEEGAVVEPAASNVDFLGAHFNVTSNPAGKANISLDASSVTLQGNSFNGLNELVRLNGLLELPPASGLNLTSLQSSNLSGLISNLLIDSSSVTKQGNAFNIPNSLVKLGLAGALPALDASNLLSLNPSNMSAGALPSNVMVSSIVAGAIQDASIVGLSASKLTGALPALNGASLTSLTPANISQGSLPSNVIVSSLAINSVQDASIAGVSASKLIGALPALDAFNLLSLNPSNMSAGALPSNVMVSSIVAGAIQDASIVGLSASKLTGALPALNGASLTSLNPVNISQGSLPSNVIVSSLAINSVQDASIVGLSASKLTGALPALNGASLTSLTPANISQGSLPSNVIVSSLAINSVQDASIMGLSASKLAGLIPNSAIDASSVTLLGNAFNGANQLVKLDSASRLLIGSTGTPIVLHISTTASLDFGALDLLDCEEKPVTLTGAQDGDSVSLGIPNTLASVNLSFFFAYVSAPNTVSVRRCALAALGNPSAVNVRIDVWRH